MDEPRHIRLPENGKTPEKEVRIQVGGAKIRQKALPRAWDQGNETCLQDDKGRKSSLRQVSVPAAQQVCQISEPGHGN